MAIQSLEAHRVATSSTVGIARAGVTASKYLPRALALVWVLSTLALAIVGVGRTLLAPRSGLASASPSSIRSSRDLLIAGTSLPGAIRLTGPGRWGQTASAMDGGVPAAIAQDRRNGFREGMVQNLRDGVRQLRVLAKLYASSEGASQAYDQAARYLVTALPDPSLHVSVRALHGLGAAATLAVYDSAIGTSHYTVTSLVARSGTLVCDIQAFPVGVANGMPARDRDDAQALGRVLIGRMAAGATNLH